MIKKIRLYGPKFSLKIILFRAKHSRYHSIKNNNNVKPLQIQVFIDILLLCI